MINQNKSIGLQRLFFLGIAILIVAGLFAPELCAAGSPKKNFTSITPEDMNQIENLHERAEDLIAHRNFRDAISVYSEILLTEPDDDDAYTNMGQAYMVLGDFHHAEDAFKNALNINPDNEIAELGLRKIADPDFSAMPGEPAVPLPASTPKPAPIILVKSAPPQPPANLPPPPTLPSILIPSPATKQTVDLTAVSSDINAILKSPLSFNQLSQIALQNAGLYRGPVDGLINENTQNAIKTFQKNNHLEVDGMAGPETWSKLKLYLDKKR